MSFCQQYRCLHGKLDQKCHHLRRVRTGWDVGEVCSPALQKHDQRQKGQQALTKYIRHDSSSSRAGKQQQHKPSVPTVHQEVPDEDSLLKVKPVKAGQSISAALSRQTRKKAAAKAAPAFTAEEAGDVLAVNLRHACHTGTYTSAFAIAVSLRCFSSKAHVQEQIAQTAAYGCQAKKYNAHFVFCIYFPPLVCMPSRPTWLKGTSMWYAFVISRPN